MPTQTFISATNARKDFFDILAGLKNSSYPMAITNKGVPEGVLMSWEDYNSWLATLETLSDPELMESIRESQKDIALGYTRSWNEVKKDLRLNDGLSDRSNKPGGKRTKNTR